MLRGRGLWPTIPTGLSPGPVQTLLSSAVGGPVSGARLHASQYATVSDDQPPEEPADQPIPPPPNAVPLLPVEVGLHYTYAEPFGEAEVTFRFPAGKTFLLENDEPILVEDLRAGDRLCLKEGQIGTITAVYLYYDPPEPATHLENGQVLSRVIGTIKHKGPAVLDVTWPGYTATSSPEHPYYSVSRQRYMSRRRHFRLASSCARTTISWPRCWPSVSRGTV